MTDPAMMRALGVLATGRPSTFPPSQPGRAELWAGLLTAAGYAPGEVASACSRLLLERPAGEWIELGDLTGAIVAARRGVERERAARERVEGLRTRQRLIDARVAELVADGWGAYEARVRACGEIPDPVAERLDRARGLAPRALGSVGDVVSGLVRGAG